MKLIVLNHLYRVYVQLYTDVIYVQLYTDVISSLIPKEYKICILNLMNLSKLYYFLIVYKNLEKSGSHTVIIRISGGQSLNPFPYTVLS